MESILLAVGIVTAIGLICGLMLAIADKVIAVKEDEKYNKIRACLPGANCGACGFAGCDGYAKALRAGKAAPNLCVPGATSTAAALAEVLGVEAGEVAVKKAFVSCGGCDGCAVKNREYRGIQTCAAAKLAGGEKLCRFGCLGYGDCAAVCPEKAIVVENGLACVVAADCLGCGKCAAACPPGLIHLIPEGTATQVRCSNRDRGPAVKAACKLGCIGCGKCAKVCEAKAITMEGGLPKINSELCVGCGKCAESCPTGSMILLAMKKPEA